MTTPTPRRSRRFLCRVARMVLLLAAAYPLLLGFIHYSATAVLPNGAVLERRIDTGKGVRVDLFHPGGGARIARDVDMLCWNDFAVEGQGTPGWFVWLGGESDVITRDDPRFAEAYARSGLRRPGGGCAGHHDAYLNPEQIIRRGLARRR